jgi:hypothetical protein
LSMPEVTLGEVTLDEVTVPVPTDRLTEFLALYARWLAAPAGSAWEVADPPPPADPVAWDAARAGEFDVGSKFWQALDEAQRVLVDAVAVSGKLEVRQLAQALDLGGSIAVVQQVVAVNAAAKLVERTDVLLLTNQGGVVVEVDGNAANVLLLDQPPDPAQQQQVE